MNTMLLAVFGLLLIAVVSSMPVEESENLQTVKSPVTEDPTTLLPPQLNDIGYEDPDEPLFPSDDDMEVAEAMVFRPAWRYRYRVGGSTNRRRKINRRNVVYEYPSWTVTGGRYYTRPYTGWMVGHFYDRHWM
ncbi:hypothetical protein L9F63_024031 [Diploptera punctata]|uniref:Uncharacterized protein n=1 Tax=Diploptera punctata TaxID=6984 RepID=A0AAD7ZHJ7_DIPPU|nr:hypothetical protein L9F63_024031 [Diploptera punctata]